MDHSHMDHGNMDHGNHGGGMPMPMCSMNVRYTPNTSPIYKPSLHKYLSDKSDTSLDVLQCCANVTMMELRIVPRQTPAMLFTWDTTNLCIIFRQWHVTGSASLVFSLLAIVAICAGYEALREGTRKYEVWLSNKEAAHIFWGKKNTDIDALLRSVRDSGAHDELRGERYQDNDPNHEREQVAETTPFLGIERIGAGLSSSESPISQRARILKAILYGVQNFYAFMIMLLFMTYNGWVMIAVAVGAGLGYYIFGSNTRATKETACH
ncbi:Ctr copper transporter family protein [Xylaria bambusicola]|uniref:Ctr copper transporter family protein n=1 Tax=Xylaria bambusicola TaxID=326684 RepID=UPI002007B758|nr:Ctr copper transporter family protein [Xylaria bambusicola]KAI0503053.1 Ctr copper transporter family protein [Xylaria bambusicola]